MSPLSSVFVESDESEKEPSTRRARSADENLDWLKEQERWRKHDQERQMVAYRNGNHYGASQQRTRADRLAVPIYEVSPRRPRARSDTRQRHDVHELSRNFTTLEVRPSSELIRRQDTSKEPAEVYVLPGHTRGSTHSKEPRIDKPKIKIPPVIVQEHPPVSNTTDQKLGNSPSASPRSPSGQPQLQLKYFVLQNKLADISLACVRYIDVEAADPRDLTFEKISEQVKGFAFDLQVWSHIANIQNMARRDVPEHARAVADAAARNMDRLIERAAELHDACSRAKPSDLKFSQLAQVDDEEGMFDDADDQGGLDPTESVGYVINAGLHSIKLQIQNLKRLTRSLQEATPDAREEVAAVAALVGDVGRYFGSEAALQRYAVDKKYSGRRALEEARDAAAR